MAKKQTKKLKDGVLYSSADLAEIWGTSQQCVMRRRIRYGVEPDQKVGRAHLFLTSNPRFEKLKPQR